MSRASRLMLLLLVALGAIGLNAPLASAASPAWWVSGSLLASGAKEAVAEATKVEEPFRVKVTGLTTECKAITAKEAFIEGEKHAAGTLVFSECSVVGVENCSIAPVTTRPLSVTLEGPKGSLKLNFKPAEGKVIYTATLSGSGCPVKTVTVEGSMACNYPDVEKESLEHELEFSLSSGTEIKANGKTAELTGIDKFKLKSGNLWSAR